MVYSNEDVSIPSVLFKENETISSESLDWFFNPRNELLPFVHAYNYGSVSYGKSKNNGKMSTWTFSGDLEVEVAAKNIEEFEVEKVEVIRYIDGKEAERMDIMLDAMIAHNTFSYNWNPIDDGRYLGSMEASIYDTDGNLLYSVDEELYR